MSPCHLHGWLRDERYSNRRRRHLGHCWPPGTWCSSYQADMKAIKKALHIIHTEESHQKFGIVSDSQSFLFRIANLQPAIPLKSAGESDILSLLTALHYEGHQITFTWCPSHCEIVRNKMADEQARKSCRQSRCSTLLRFCKGHHQACCQRGKFPMMQFAGCMAWKEKILTAEKNHGCHK